MHKPENSTACCDQAHAQASVRLEVAPVVERAWSYWPGTQAQVCSPECSRTGQTIEVHVANIGYGVTWSMPRIGFPCVTLLMTIWRGDHRHQASSTFRSSLLLLPLQIMAMTILRSYYRQVSPSFLSLFFASVRVHRFDKIYPHNPARRVNGFTVCTYMIASI